MSQVFSIEHKSYWTMSLALRLAYLRKQTYFLNQWPTLTELQKSVRLHHSQWFLFCYDIKYFCLLKEADFYINHFIKCNVHLCILLMTSTMTATTQALVMSYSHCVCVCMRACVTSSANVIHCTLVRAFDPELDTWGLTSYIHCRIPLFFSVCK